MRTSVLTVTYNHERFIAQAIDSILAQDDPNFELVIGEDCSTDNTREQVREYARKHPGRIRLIESERNLGGRANFLRTLAACRGTYLALVDGDDFLTSPHKVRAQADFLDAHPECATCFHASIEVDAEGNQVGEVFHPPGRRPRYGLLDILPTNIANSCAVMFRRRLLEDLPPWFPEIPVADWPLHVLSACHGELGYLDEAMAAHRNHPDGLWAGKSPADQMRINVRTQAMLIAHLEPQHEGLRECIAKEYLERALAHRSRGEFSAARGYLDWCRKQHARQRGMPRLKFWKLYAKVVWEERGAGARQEPTPAV